MGSPAVEVAPGIYRIPTMGDFVNTVMFIEDDGSVTLVDCGYKNAPKRIVRGLESIGKHPKDVQRIVLTHAHNDHAGGAAEMVETTELTGVQAHEQDADFIESGQGSPTDGSTLVGRIMLRTSFGGFAPVPVELRLNDGDELPIAGGVTIHHTPGHTPGHISLLHRATGSLVTGDAIWNMRGRSWPVSAFCSDHKLNRTSAHVLGELEYDNAVFTHGPHIAGSGREAIRSFLQKKGY